MQPYIQPLQAVWNNFVRHVPLLMNLISRDLKKKYRRSVLGYVWCVLNPLLVMLIMNFVFSNMFKNNIDNFPVYLFVGRMVFSFITDSTSGVMTSFISNGALMRKTRIPYYIFPMARFSTSIVNFLFTLVAFTIVLIGTQTPITIHVIAFPAVVLQFLLFSFGLGLLLSQANTFIRDINYLYSVFTTAWMYLTPLFYPIEALPDIARWIIATFNPAYTFIQQARQIFLYNQWPSGTLMLIGYLWAISAMLFGGYAYWKCRNKLILYV